MTFVGIEFLEDEGGGSVALVCNNWFTPRKTKVLWPPYRKQEHYYKALKAKETPDEHTWEIYKIKKKFFETDDYQKALHKIKLAEATSDLQSDLGEDENRPKRKRRAVQKLYDTDESGSENVLPRPPPITNLQTTRSHILDEHVASPRSFLTSTPTSSLSAISNTSFVAYPPYTPTLTPSHVNETVLVNQEKDTSHKIIINLLQQIKEQNQQILYRMNKQDSATCSSNLPEIPVPLPLKDCQELGIFEEYVAEREHSFHVSDYLSTLGGRDSTALTNNILKRCLTNELASKYSFRGKSKKKPFIDLHLRSVVVNAVKKKNPNCSEKDIEDYIKIWLKHSPQRFKADCMRKKKNAAT